MCGMRVLRLALLWILLKAQMPSVEALEEEIPAQQETEHALVTASDPHKKRERSNGVFCSVRKDGEEVLAGKKKKQKQPGKGPNNL